MPEKEVDISELTTWCRRHWPGGDPGRPELEPIPADGSPRRFLRLTAGGRSLVALANPGNPAENRAWHYFARHLAGCGLPVARVLAADLERGRFLMEDLGRRSLQEAVREAGGDEDRLAAFYRPVLEMLARLQADGAQGLDTSVCFDGAELTPEFLLQREAGYFLKEFVTGACGQDPARLTADFWLEMKEICRLAGRAGPRGLVHRDFQSRNIIMEEGRLGLVDFQGARLGPAQYDLASLLHDPYVQLPFELRHRLREEYQQIRAGLGGWDPERFLAGWPYVSASRIMQALGAYAFLCRRRGRGHFAPYVSPALESLQHLVRQEAFAPFRLFRNLVLSLEAPPPERLEPVEEEA